MIKIPIRDDEIIALRGTNEFDLDALRAAVEPLGLELHIGTRFALIYLELKHLVEQKGISYVWQLVRQRETVLPIQDATEIVGLLASMLNRLAPTQDFIIVDRYLLPRNGSSDYLNTLKVLITPIGRMVRHLTLVTGSEYDPQLLNDLTAQVSPSGENCQIVHQVSEAFHDRFWIADRQRGLFIGTSLNGIGRRYALVDYIQEDDVREIVAALVSEDLL